MIKPIIKDQQLLAKKATPTTKADLPLANDLSDTLNIHQAECWRIFSGKGRQEYEARS